MISDGELTTDVATGVDRIEIETLERDDDGRLLHPDTKRILSEGDELPDGSIVGRFGDKWFLKHPTPERTEDEIAEAILNLREYHCSYPDGKPLSRQTGLPCRGNKMKNGRCNSHGGNSLVGRDSKTFKDGRYSKAMPKQLIQRYRTAESDPSLLSLRSEIAYMEARVDSLLQAVRDGEGPQTDWEVLQSQFVRLNVAIENSDAEELEAAVTSIGNVINDNAREAAAFTEIDELVQKKAKLAEKEWKRQKDLHQFMTVQQAMDLVTGLSDIVVETLTIQKLRAIAVAEEIDDDIVDQLEKSGLLPVVLSEMAGNMSKLLHARTNRGQ